MFQNSYQNGTFFQLYDPKISQDRLKSLFRLANVQANNKVFDKDLKTFVLEFSSPTAKICFPKEDKKDLYLIQQFLVIQIFFFPGMSWTMELVISDLTKTKRRIILSPATHKIEVKPFFVKTPCQGFAEGMWNNFVIDLFSYIEAFKGQGFRSLDNIYLTGHFKLKRIYTTSTEPALQSEDENSQTKPISFLPKHFSFPFGLPFATKINRYQEEIFMDNHYEPTEPSTKNSSYMKVKPPRMVPNPKSELIKTQKKIKQSDVKKIKGFLANTNGTQMLNRMRKEEQQKFNDSDTSQGHPSESMKTAKSTQKSIKSKPYLVKTQQMPPKLRPSIERNSSKVKEDKAKAKAKLNPWRTCNTKNSLPYHNKLDQGKTTMSAQTSMFKTNDQLVRNHNETNKGFGIKSDHYSDSEYVERSQKFSTITDGKFFKQDPQIVNNEDLNNGQDEIQEKIEMETNSIYSDSNKKEEERPGELIKESIADSLDKQSPQRKKISKEIVDLSRSSLYGFGDKLMKEYMGGIERPYSPPLCEREATEEQVSRNQNQNEKDEVELIYDPVLNCYYDHRTHTYYELKN